MTYSTNRFNNLLAIKIEIGKEDSLHFLEYIFFLTGTIRSYSHAHRFLLGLPEVSLILISFRFSQFIQS